MLQPLQMEDSQQDVLVTQDSQAWIGQEINEADVPKMGEEEQAYQPPAVQYEDADGNVISTEKDKF